jgi:hypothetical protein
LLVPLQPAAVEAGAAEEGGGHRPGAQHRDLDAEGRQFAAQGFGQVQHVGLAGEVIAHQRPGLEGCHGRDIENLPAAAPLHVRTQGMAEAGDGQHVELDQVLFLPPVLVDEQPGAADAGIVHQQVDVALALFQFLDQPGELQGFGQVTDA